MMQQCIFNYYPEEITASYLPPPQPPLHFFHIDDITAAAVAALQSSFTNPRVDLKMAASSAYIPKENQGDDAHFISPENQTMGLADGVGGWAKLGIDGGDYARRLMNNSVLALRRRQYSNHVIVNPKAVLEEAYNTTHAQGSSTACIITLSGDTLRAANVGDSGFLVIRNGGDVVFRSPTQQRRFNCPYQLGSTKDDPSVAEEMEVAVEAGDVVVAGTDGLFDNVHEREVVEIVTTKGKDEEDLEGKACYMANAALYNSFDRYRDSPFSIGSRKAGKCHSGGKIDDITVIIARIHHQYH